MKNKLGISSTEKMQQCNNHVFSSVSNTHDILGSINKLQVSNQTAKSRISLVYNFGEFADINISFANNEKNKIRLSKGITQILQTKSFSKEEWNDLSTAHLQNGSQSTITIKSKKTMKISFLLSVNNHNIFETLKNKLIEIDNWASVNYPLVIGIDQFSPFVDISSIDLLSLILSTRNLKYIFYYCGINNMEFLDIPQNNKINEKECPKGYLTGYSKRDCFLNSMIELRNLIQQYDQLNADIYKQVLNNLKCQNFRTSSIVISDIASNDMNIYDNNLKKFLLPTTSKYRMGYCLEGEGSYVPFDEKERRFVTYEKYILVSRDTQLMLNSELLENLRKINIAACNIPTIRWLDGVPGCGKTHLILQKHTPGKDLILTQTRTGIREIRMAVKNLNQNKYDNIINLDYRTVSSFIINGSYKKYERVFIDEAVLMHAGYVGFISELTNANEIILLGDSNQIPYIERSKLITKWSHISVFCDPDSYQEITRRCPIDVCYTLSKYYKKIYTTNQTIRSIRSTISNGDFFQLEPDTLILSFTQAEKKLLLQKLKNIIHDSIKIHTIHEAQGLTFKNVVLVRINTKPLKIYDSLQHVIVAISRHTHSFRYLTTGEKDLMLSITKNIELIEDNYISNWHNKEKITTHD